MQLDKWHNPPANLQMILFCSLHASSSLFNTFYVFIIIW